MSFSVLYIVRIEYEQYEPRKGNDMINDYNEEDWTDAPDPHQETFKNLFGESIVDFKAFFKAGDFDKDRSAEHYEKLGRTLAEIYQADFEEDNGYFKNQCDHPVTRACDITESTLARAMGLHLNGGK